MILFYFGLVTHVADGIDRYKGLGIYLADVVHQLLVLVLVNDGDHLHLGRLVVAPMISFSVAPLWRVYRT